MGSGQSQEQQEYLEAQQEIEQVAWFFKKYPIEKQEYKTLYNDDENNLKTQAFKELLPKTFEEFWKEMEEILKNNSEKLKNSKKPTGQFFWGKKYYNYKESDNSKLKHCYLLILHYAFMHLILRKIYFYNKYVNQSKEKNL